MEIVALGLVLIGTIMMFIGGIWLIIEAFKESFLWGCGYMIVPFVSLIFIIVHWENARQPFFLNLAGFAVCVLGVLVAPGSIEDFGN